jgi:hypothetical protein
MSAAAPAAAAAAAAAAPQFQQPMRPLPLLSALHQQKLAAMQDRALSRFSEVALVLSQQNRGNYVDDVDAFGDALWEALRCTVTDFRRGVAARFEAAALVPAALEAALPPLKRTLMGLSATAMSNVLAGTRTTSHGWLLIDTEGVDARHQRAEANRLRSHVYELTLTVRPVLALKDDGGKQRRRIQRLQQKLRNKR